MERNLIKRAKQGDKDAFLKLMNAQMQTMYKLAWTYLKNEDDVADIVQDTILTCFEKLPTLREEKYFKTWMMKIVINHCKNLLKKEKRTIHEVNLYLSE
nr:sigma-70 family RNA polymerase sigma factor [uncultured Schaedlerella sp.]